MVIDKFCKMCGAAHTDTAFPLTCQSCKHMTWKNPFPVAVLLVPVTDGERTGILIGKRGIQPAKHEWGLPGGFIDPTDKTVEGAACRELYEETGFKIKPSRTYLFYSYSNGDHLLVFTKSLDFLHVDDLVNFKPCYECPEIGVAWEPQQLCFESHTLALAKVFSPT